MNTIENALELEYYHDYAGAISMYKKIIGNMHPPVDAFINLAFLYWSVVNNRLFDRSLKKECGVPAELLPASDKMYEFIINMGLQEHPQNIELAFWKLYFSEISYGKDVIEADYISLLTHYHNDSLVPYLVLAAYDKTKYRNELYLLREECSIHPTAKNLYIKAVIEGMPNL
ncbi:hypothetical protein CLV58_1398 [Spirosoma oryzae]|uniref:Tetratricopeptide repeat protein n=1 Tax=Spirosoma oryzae TaxID=1469603 RepID=A0A2T0RTV6_9BACT|nr:hypothetical protein [Spirosoma oryzae]PRY24540.1 hypothetical protein CLV58_1398 [Spirosoma oryzae]